MDGDALAPRAFGASQFRWRLAPTMVRDQSGGPGPLWFVLGLVA
jgi:hypothetical protein